MKKLFSKLGIIAQVILFSQSEIFAQSNIAGVLKDSNGDSLIGASVLVKGVAVGSIKDIDGNYSLRVLKGATERIVFQGYGSVSLILQMEIMEKSGFLKIVVN